MNPILRSVLLSAVVMTAGAPVFAASIKVVTEYRYPTSYDVDILEIPVQVGGVWQRSRIAGIVTPRNFEMREVGVSLNVEAVAYTTPAASRALTRARTRDHTDLMIAAASGDLATVQRLVRSERSVINARNRNGATALMGAAAGGFGEVVRFLLLYRAAPDNRDRNGATALMFAARNGHTEVMRMLLESGARIDSADGGENTALMYAVAAGRKEAAALLLDAGAGRDYRNRYGLSPVGLAANRRNRDMIVLLTPAVGR